MDVLFKQMDDHFHVRLVTFRKLRNIAAFMHKTYCRKSICLIKTEVIST